MVAVIWVAFTHVDETAFPFHCTAAKLGSKFEPYKVMVTADAPAAAVEGAILVSAGTSGGVPPLVPDPPPPQLASNEANTIAGSTHARFAITETLAEQTKSANAAV
jgi:hypothetical protein